MIPNLKVTIGDLELPNPVLVASGTFGYGQEFEPFLDLTSLGAIVVKGITLRPRKGNPSPRVVETPAGLLNSIGLENPGLAAFKRDKLPYLKDLKVRIIVNICGQEISEYVKLAKGLRKAEGIDALELNISCPNIKQGGMVFGKTPQLTSRVVKAVRKATDLPLIVKLTPNVSDITAIARAAESAGADAISLVNTLMGMAIDIQTRRPKLYNNLGGLSGPAIKPVALAMVFEVAREVKIPVIGMGGISSAEDAIEFFLAGATSIAIGTANLVDPSISIKIIDGIKKYLIKNNIPDINNLIGTVKLFGNNR